LGSLASGKWWFLQLRSIAGGKEPDYMTCPSNPMDKWNDGSNTCYEMSYGLNIGTFGKNYSANPSASSMNRLSKVAELTKYPNALNCIFVMDVANYKNNVAISKTAEVYAFHSYNKFFYPFNTTAQGVLGAIHNRRTNALHLGGHVSSLGVGDLFDSEGKFIKTGLYKYMNPHIMDTCQVHNRPKP
jgi:prepilin-type processing-associated H-X9-DG protein